MFYRSGSTAGVQNAHTKCLRLILSNLDQAETPDDMDLPGLRLNERSGSRTGILASCPSRAAGPEGVRALGKRAKTSAWPKQI